MTQVEWVTAAHHLLRSLHACGGVALAVRRRFRGSESLGSGLVPARHLAAVRKHIHVRRAAPVRDPSPGADAPAGRARRHGGGDLEGGRALERGVGRDGEDDEVLLVHTGDVVRVRDGERGAGRIGLVARVEVRHRDAAAVGKVAVRVDVVGAAVAKVPELVHRDDGGHGRADLVLCHLDVEGTPSRAEKY
jgi:hypothetical protein